MSDRTVRVKATWTTEHEITVPSDHPRFGTSDLDGLLEVSGEDITALTAELSDWEIKDPGPELCSCVNYCLGQHTLEGRLCREAADNG